MKVFIYYDRTEEEDCDDVAIVRAKSKKDAKAILSKYYTDLSNAVIKEIRIGDENLPEIEIISDY